MQTRTTNTMRQFSRVGRILPSPFKKLTQDIKVFKQSLNRGDTINS